MRSIFGWDLPPGVSQQMIDDAFGHEGPLDCPVCNDGVEMDGSDCEKCANVSCIKHGCIVCQDLEKQRPMPQGYGEALAKEAKWAEDQEKFWVEEAAAQEEARKKGEISRDHRSQDSETGSARGFGREVEGPDCRGRVSCMEPEREDAVGGAEAHLSAFL